MFEHIGLETLNLRLSIVRYRTFIELKYHLNRYMLEVYR